MAGITEKIIWKSVTVGDVTTGISVAAAIAGYFAQRDENRKIIGLLKDIKNHLNIIDRKIDFITEQNRQIITMLDELPSKIRAIVAEEVRNELNISTLDERYSSIISIQNNYFNLPEEERLRYRIHTQGWDRLTENLTYIFKFENRVSHIPRLIQICEFAQVVSERKGAAVVKQIIEEKKERLVKLFNEYEKQYNKYLTNFENILMTKYVKEYSIKATLNSFDFSYSLASKKPETETFLHYGPARPGGHWNGEPIEVTRRLPENIKFNEEMMKHQNKISSTHNEFTIMHRNMIELVTMKLLLETYYQAINEDLNLISNENIELSKDVRIKSNSDFFIGYEE